MKKIILLSLLLFTISLSAQTPNNEQPPLPKKLVKPLNNKNNNQSQHTSIQDMIQPPQSGIMIQSDVNFEQFKVDADLKRQDIVYLVKDAIDYLISHRPEEAFYAFLYNRRFTKGDVTLFVLDTAGNLYVQEEGLNDIWDNVLNFKNENGNKIYKGIIDKANTGGGWVSYGLLNDFKSSYVEKVEKDGVSYVLGAGWFPSTKDLEVERLVRSAAATFEQEGKKQAFSEFSNSVGRFVIGDLYVYAYDTKGYCLAHGDNVALIGRDLSDQKDDKGFFFIKALIQKAKKDGEGWVPYTWNGVPKIGYVKLVSDATGDYIIGSGYYPETDRTSVAFLVKRAVKYFYAWGREKADSTFSKVGGEFTLGDQMIFMYDFEGNVLAQGDNPILVGQNIIDLRASDGSYIIQDLINFAKAGGGWCSFEWKNDMMLAYIEKVMDPEGNYIIGSGFFPDTKREKVEQLVRSAKGFFTNTSLPQAMRTFRDRMGSYVMGTLNILIFNMQGDCL